MEQESLYIQDFLKENPHIAALLEENHHILGLLEEIERLKTKCDKQAMILRRIFVENYPNTYFLTGEAGEKDDNNLPEYVLICPAYGSDWVMKYKRTDETSSPEY